MPRDSPGSTGLTSSVEAELARRLALGEEVVLATVIKLDGEPPSTPGSKLLLSRTAALAGTLGCSEFDAAALGDAHGVSETGTPQLRTYHHDLGSIDVYLEPHASAPTLVIFGATPVAKALLRSAPEVGFRAILVETRPDRLRGAEWPEAISSLSAVAPALGTDVYAVHTDHDAEDLVLALETLPQNARFIGLVGSRRHTGHHLEALRAKGIPSDVIDRIQSPVGLDLGHLVTPQEIALSILAGLVAIRRGGQGGWKVGRPA